MMHLLRTIGLKLGLVTSVVAADQPQQSLIQLHGKNVVNVEAFRSYCTRAATENPMTLLLDFPMKDFLKTQSNDAARLGFFLEMCSIEVLMHAAELGDRTQSATIDVLSPEHLAKVRQFCSLIRGQERAALESVPSDVLNQIWQQFSDENSGITPPSRSEIIERMLQMRVMSLIEALQLLMGTRHNLKIEPLPEMRAALRN